MDEQSQATLGWKEPENRAFPAAPATPSQPLSPQSSEKSQAPGQSRTGPSRPESPFGAAGPGQRNSSRASSEPPDPSLPGPSEAQVILGGHILRGVSGIVTWVLRRKGWSQIDWRMREDEARHFAEPIVRIVARRMQLKGVSGDAVDAGAAGGNAVDYVTRVLMIDDSIPATARDSEELRRLELERLERQAQEERARADAEARREAHMRFEQEQLEARRRQAAAETDATAGGVAEEGGVLHPFLGFEDV